MTHCKRKELPLRVQAKFDPLLRPWNFCVLGLGASATRLYLDCHFRQSEGTAWPDKPAVSSIGGRQVRIQKLVLVGWRLQATLLDPAQLPPHWSRCLRVNLRSLSLFETKVKFIWYVLWCAIVTPLRPSYIFHAYFFHILNSITGKNWSSKDILKKAEIVSSSKLSLESKIEWKLLQKIRSEKN